MFRIAIRQDHREPRRPRKSATPLTDPAAKQTKVRARLVAVSVLVVGALFGSGISSAKTPYSVASNYPEAGSRTNNDYVRMEHPIEYYSQKLVLHFDAKADPSKVKVSVLPLYNGYEWAVSSRWDDNSLDDLKMSDVLARYNCKATWFLNDPYESPEFTSISSRLLEGGNSIGGHSLTHTMLSYVNRNQMFREVALARARWEAVSDSCVISHAFSFEEHRNDLEGDLVQKDITHNLYRAGYYAVAHGCYHKRFKTDLILCPFMPIDGLEIDGFVEEAMRDPYYKKEHPLLTYAQHVWYITPQAWEKFESQLAKYTGNKDWWYCNQNQYAAYRFGYRHSRITKKEDGKHTLSFVIKRPELLELNDSVPISLLVEGPGANQIESVTCDTAECAVSGLATDKLIVNLSHDRTKSLPIKIGLIENRDNKMNGTPADRDSDYPQIASWLSYENDTLRLAIKNQGASEIKDLRIIFRMPLAFKDGVKRYSIDRIPANSAKTVTYKPTPATADYKYTAGSTLFLAQMDFRSDAAPARLHATCEADLSQRDFSYPQNGFLRSAPIPAGRTSLGDLIQTAQEQAGKHGSLDTPWKMPDGATLSWHHKTDNEVRGQPFLDVEVIKIRDGANVNKWLSPEPVYYVLQSAILSEKAQPVGFIRDPDSIKAIILNNELITQNATRLRKGPNSIALIWSPDPAERFRRENAGCFFRLIDPGTSKRLEKIKFQSAF